MPPVVAALNANSSEIMEILLRKGASTEIKTSDGNTLLHFSALQNQRAMLDHLLKSELRRDNETRNRDGLTPLLIAVKMFRIVKEEPH